MEIAGWKKINNVIMGMGMAVHLVVFLIMVSLVLVLPRFVRSVAMELLREPNFVIIMEEKAVARGALQI